MPVSDGGRRRSSESRMAAEQFPMFRLATLLARQFSSPIATRIKDYAKSHPRFGRTVCMRSGRMAAAAELRFKLWTLQVRRPYANASALPALSDQRALEAGADLLGEMIIFALGAAIVTFEFSRQAEKQEVKANAEQSAWLAVQLQVEELRLELEAQQRDIDRLAATLRTFASDAPRASAVDELQEAPHGPTTAPHGPATAPHGPVAAPHGPVAAPHGPIATPSDIQPDTPPASHDKPHGLCTCTTSKPRRTC